MEQEIRSFRDYQREAQDRTNLRGRVVEVEDADTIKIQTAEGEIRTVRFAHIDAPETFHKYPDYTMQAQPGAYRARDRLAELTPVGSEVNVFEVDSDAYGRTVGEVYTGESYVNLQLAREGFAHVYNYRGDLDSYYQSGDFAAAAEAAYREGRPVSRWEHSPASWRAHARGQGELERATRYESNRYQSGEFGFIYRTPYTEYQGAVPQYTSADTSAKPLMPTKLDASFFDRHIGKALPEYMGYAESYRAITGEEAPQEAIEMDKAISTPSLGHQINRLLGERVYQEGMGLVGSLATYVGRTIDRMLGHQALQEDQLQRSGQLRGGVSRFMALPYQEQKYEYKPGLFESIFAATAQTATGFAVAAFGYGVTLTSQFTASAMLERGMQHLIALGSQQSWVQQKFAESLMSDDDRAIDRLTREKIAADPTLDRSVAVQKAKEELFPAGSRAPSSSGGFFQRGLSSFRQLEGEAIEQLGGSILELIVPEANRTDARTSFKSLLEEIRAPIQVDFEAQTLKGYGASRVSAIAKHIDSLTQYVPANLFYWIPALRDAAGMKEVGEGSISSVYGQGVLTPVITNFITVARTSARLASDPLKTLREAAALHKGTRTLVQMEQEILQALQVRASQGHLDQDIRHVKARTNRGMGVGYRQYLEEASLLHARVQTYQGVDTALSTDTTQNLTRNQGRARANVQTLLKVGAVLGADYLFDQFVLKTQGATLYQQVSLFKAVQGEDGAVVRYEFNATMPVAVSLLAAVSAGGAAGYLFPTVQTVAPTQQAFGQTLKAFREAADTSEKTKLRLNKLLDGVDGVPHTTRVRFNTRAAAFGAALGLVGTKVAYVGAAQVMNSIFNRQRGVKLDAQKDLAASYLLYSLNRQDMSDPTVGDVAGREVLKSLVEAYKTGSTSFNTQQGYYSIAQQFSLGFVQFATLARSDPRSNVTSFSFGMQVLPTLGIGITPVLPFGVRIKSKGQEEGPSRSAVEFANMFGGESLVGYQRALGLYGGFESIAALNPLNALAYVPGSNIEVGGMAVGLLGVTGAAIEGLTKPAQAGTLRYDLQRFVAREFADAAPLAKGVAGAYRTARMAGMGVLGFSFAIPQVFREGTRKMQGRASLSTTPRSGRTSAYLAVAAAAYAMTDLSVEDSEDSIYHNPLVRLNAIAQTTALYGGMVSDLGVFANEAGMAQSRSTIARIMPGADRLRAAIANPESSPLRRAGARAGLLMGAIALSSLGAKAVSRVAGTLGGAEAIEALYSVLPVLKVGGGVEASQYKSGDRNLMLDLAGDFTSMISGGNFNLATALGFYKDDPNLFLPAFGLPFGFSFREDGSVRTYTQVASPNADLSYSVYGLFRTQMSSDLMLQMEAITGAKVSDPTLMYALARGAVGKQRPAQISDYTGYELQALGGGLSLAMSRRRFIQTHLSFQRASELAMDLHKAGVAHGRVGMQHTRRKIPFMGTAPLDGLDLQFLPMLSGKPSAFPTKNLYDVLESVSSSYNRQVYAPQVGQQARDLMSMFVSPGSTTPLAATLVGIPAVGLVATSVIMSGITGLQFAAAIESSFTEKSSRIAAVEQAETARRVRGYLRTFSYETLVDEAGDAFILQRSSSGRTSTGRLAVPRGTDPQKYLSSIQKRMSVLGSTVEGYLGRSETSFTTASGQGQVNLFDELLQPGQLIPDQVKQKLKESYQKRLFQTLQTKVVGGKSLFETIYYPQLSSRMSGSATPDAYLGTFLDEVVTDDLYQPLIQRVEELQKNPLLSQAAKRRELNKLRAELEFETFKNRMGQATPYSPSEFDMEQLSAREAVVARAPSLNRSTLLGAGVGAARGVASLTAKYMFYLQPAYGIAEGASYLMSDSARERRLGARQVTKLGGYQLASVAIAAGLQKVFRTNPLVSALLSAGGLMAYDSFSQSSGFGRAVKSAESAVGDRVAGFLEGAAGLLSPVLAPLGSFLRTQIFQPLGERIYQAYNESAKSSMAAMLIAEVLLPSSLFKTGQEWKSRRTYVGREPIVYGSARAYYQQKNMSGLMATAQVGAGVDEEIIHPFLQGKATGYRERALQEAFFGLGMNGRTIASPLQNFSIQSMYQLSGQTRLALQRRQELYAYYRYGSILRRPEKPEDYSFTNSFGLALSNLQRKSIDLGMDIVPMLQGEFRTLQIAARPYVSRLKAGRLVRGVQAVQRRVGTLKGRTKEALKQLVKPVGDRVGKFLSGGEKRAQSSIAARFGQLKGFAQARLESIKGFARKGFELGRQALAAIGGLFTDIVAPVAATGVAYGLAAIRAGVMRVGAAVGQGIIKAIEVGGKQFPRLANLVDFGTVKATVDNAVQQLPASPPQTPSTVRTALTKGRAAIRTGVRETLREARLSAPVITDTVQLVGGLSRLNRIDSLTSTGKEMRQTYTDQAGLATGVIAGSVATLVGLPVLPVLALSLGASVVASKFAEELAIRDILRGEEQGKRTIQLMSAAALVTTVATNLHSRSRTSLLDPSRVEFDEVGEARMLLSRRTRNALRRAPQGSTRRLAAQIEVVHERTHLKQAQAASRKGEFASLHKDMFETQDLLKRAAGSDYAEAQEILDRMSQRSTQRAMSQLDFESARMFTQEDYQRIYQQEYEANTEAYRYAQKRGGSRGTLKAFRLLDRRQAKGMFERQFDLLGRNAQTPQAGIVRDVAQFDLPLTTTVEPGVRYIGGGSTPIKTREAVKFHSVINPLLESVSSKATSAMEKISNHAVPGLDVERATQRFTNLKKGVDSLLARPKVSHFVGELVGAKGVKGFLDFAGAGVGAIQLGLSMQTLSRPGGRRGARQAMGSAYGASASTAATAAMFKLVLEGRKGFAIGFSAPILLGLGMTKVGQEQGQSMLKDGDSASQMIAYQNLVMAQQVGSASDFDQTLARMRGVLSQNRVDINSRRIAARVRLANQTVRRSSRLARTNLGKARSFLQQKAQPLTRSARSLFGAFANTTGQLIQKFKPLPVSLLGALANTARQMAQKFKPMPTSIFGLAANTTRSVISQTNRKLRSFNLDLVSRWMGTASQKVLKQARASQRKLRRAVRTIEQFLQPRPSRFTRTSAVLYKKALRSVRSLGRNLTQAVSPALQFSQGLFQKVKSLDYGKLTAITGQAVQQLNTFGGKLLQKTGSLLQGAVSLLPKPQLNSFLQPVLQPLFGAAQAVQQKAGAAFSYLQANTRLAERAKVVQQLAQRQTAKAQQLLAKPGAGVRLGKGVGVVGAGALGAYSIYEGYQQAKRGDVLGGTAVAASGGLASASLAATMFEKSRPLAGRLAKGADFALGGYDIFRGSQMAAEAEEQASGYSRAYGRVGKGVGRIGGSIVGTSVGLGLMAKGGALFMGGLAATGTGVGALVGAPAMVAGGVLVLAGAATVLLSGEVGAFVGQQAGKVTGAIRTAVENPNQTRQGVRNFFRGLMGKAPTVEGGVVYTSSFQNQPGGSAQTPADVYAAGAVSGQVRGEGLLRRMTQTGLAIGTAAAATAVSPLVTGVKMLASGMFRRSDQITGRARVTDIASGSTTGDRERQRRARLLMNTVGATLSNTLRRVGASFIPGVGLLGAIFGGQRANAAGVSAGHRSGGGGGGGSSRSGTGGGSSTPTRRAMTAREGLSSLLSADRFTRAVSASRAAAAGTSSRTSGARATRATTLFRGVIVTSAVDASGEPGLDYVVEEGRRGARFGALTPGRVVEIETRENWESNLERGDTRRGYGNFIRVRTKDPQSGREVDVFYAHADQVHVRVGQQVGVGTVLGTQGRTGSTTGAHVSTDFFEPGTYRGSNASIAMRDRIARTLATNVSSLNAQIQQAQPQARSTPGVVNFRAPQTPTSPAGQRSSRAITPDSIFSGGSNSLAARIVGVSEGNRTADGGFTRHYQGHTDPGNAAHNIGSFSYQVRQGGANTPQQADELWNNRLRTAYGQYQQAATRAGLNASDPKLLFNFLDLYTQAPLAATGRGGFLDQFDEIAQGRSIIDARVRSYYDPNTGRLDAPGFNNSESRLRRDQLRRMDAVQAGIQANLRGIQPAPTAQANAGSQTGASDLQIRNNRFVFRQATVDRQGRAAAAVHGRAGEVEMNFNLGGIVHFLNESRKEANVRQLHQLNRPLNIDELLSEMEDVQGSSLSEPQRRQLRSDIETHNRTIQSGRIIQYSNFETQTDQPAPTAESSRTGTSRPQVTAQAAVRRVFGAERLAQRPTQSTTQQGSRGSTLAPATGRSYIRVTRSGRKDEYGNELLNTQLVGPDGRVIDSIRTISGSPGRQAFRTAGQSQAGSFEPLPEGVYGLGGNEWAAGRGNYSASFGEGLGAFWVTIDSDRTGTARSALGIHLDANRSYAPGTAGCIGLLSTADATRVAGWVDRHNPGQMVVDWNLGTLPNDLRRTTRTPAAPSPQSQSANTTTPQVRNGRQVFRQMQVGADGGATAVSGRAGEVEMNYNLGNLLYGLNQNRAQNRVRERYELDKSLDYTQLLRELQHVGGRNLSENQQKQLKADIETHNRTLREGRTIAYGTPDVEVSASRPEQSAQARVSSYTGSRQTGREVKLSEREFYQLAVISNLEATTRQGAVDVAQSLFNRLHSGRYGRNVSEMLFAPGQYEPFFGRSESEIRDEASAIRFLQSKGHSEATAQRLIREFRTDMSDPNKMQDARKHVGGRTSFKGVTMYGFRVEAEDPLRQRGENFFHIDGDQTYEQLRKWAGMGPLRVLLNEADPSRSVYDAGNIEIGGAAPSPSPPRTVGFQYGVPQQKTIAQLQAAAQKVQERGGGVLRQIGQALGFRTAPAQQAQQRQEQAVRSFRDAVQSGNPDQIKAAAQVLKIALPVITQANPVVAAAVAPVISPVVNQIVAKSDEIVGLFEKATRQIGSIVGRIANAAPPRVREGTIRFYGRRSRVSNEGNRNYGTGTTSRSFAGSARSVTARVSGGGGSAVRRSSGGTRGAAPGRGSGAGRGRASSGPGRSYARESTPAARRPVAPGRGSGAGAGYSVPARRSRPSANVLSRRYRSAGNNNQRANRGGSSFTPFGL